MNLLRKLFHKRPKHNIPPMPEWEEIVEMMYDRQLDGYAQELVQVIYSKDRSKRYIILKDGKGYFTYQLEGLYPYDQVDWQYIASHRDVLPAMWEPDGIAGKSIFQSTEDILRELRTEPDYQRYF